MSQTLTIKSARKPQAVTLTDAAVVKVRELIASEGDPGLALRLAVRSGGCSGFSYEMYFDSETDSTDQMVDYGDVKVVVDTESAGRLQGTVLDYKDGLMGAGFAINNPNVTRSCGCGNSFS
jgi:iron-sulfur cluster assembly protein/iron-sulfur cluster insertion protein